MLRLLLACLAWLFVSHAAAAIVDDMRVIGDGSRTRLVIDLDRTPVFGVMRLSDPFRIAIDLADTSFRRPPGKVEARGLVADYRYGLIAPGKARIVLDLTGPVTVEESFTPPGSDAGPVQLVIDLAPAEREVFLIEAARDRVAAAARTQATQALAATAPSAVPALAPDGAAEASSLPVVAIDPGHGGIDTGARGKNGAVEKDLTLAFAQALARELKKNGRVAPVLTREGDVFLSLGERVEAARRRGAALLVSVHADTVRQQNVRGATVYTLSDDASDDLAAALAERENRSDILAGLALDDQPDEVADILFDLARRETKNLSVRFARALVADLKPSVVMNGRPWRRGAFKVLKAPDVPSVLLELGFLSNKTDQNLLRSDKWREKTARAVARSIETFLGQPVVAGQGQL